MMPFRLLAPALLGAVSVLRLVGCSSDAKPKPTIQNKGSDTMVELAKAWADKYAAASVGASGGGTGVGISALMSGTVDIANASRALSPEEIERVRSETGKNPVQHMVGHDALALYVHRDNPVSEITIEQLKQIFGQGGAITRWSDLGLRVPGCEADDRIMLVGRQTNSGTREHFREVILGMDGKYTPGTTEASSSRELVILVGKTPCAIGYSGMGYMTPEVRILKVKGESGDAVLPSARAVYAKSYPISRPLYMFTLGPASGHLKTYIDWVRSDAGQTILSDMGYVPLQAEERSGIPGAGSPK